MTYEVYRKSFQTSAWFKNWIVKQYIHTIERDGRDNSIQSSWVLKLLNKVWIETVGLSVHYPEFKLLRERTHHVVTMKYEKCLIQ